MTTQIEQNLTIYGLNENVAYCEAIGLSKCFESYAKNSHGDIMQIGFNANSGYVYIALENGISICSLLGKAVEYLATDFETGEEYFFDSMSEAEKFISSLNN